MGGFSAPLLADEKKDKTMFGKTKADRVRQYATADNVFDHFASYQVVSDTGKKTTWVSTRNFYNAMTPGSHLGEEAMFGKSVYKQIAPTELNSKYVREANKMPVAREGSLLNAINEHGLLSYTDFHFLLQLMWEGASSGLVRYLFGDDLSGSLTIEDFVMLQ